MTLSPDQWKEVQTALNEKYYPCGLADGIPGKKTLLALRHFLFEHHLKSNTAPPLTADQMTLELASKVKSAPKRARLIDISYYQDESSSDPIGDLKSAQASGVCGVIIRCGGAEGGVPHGSKEYKEYWEQAGQLGMLRSVYFFHDFRATPQAHAKKWKEIVGDYPKGSLIPFLDFEDRKAPIKGKACLDHVVGTLKASSDALGVRVGIYTAKGVFLAHAADLDDPYLAESPLYVTDYDGGEVQASRIPKAHVAKGARLVQLGYDDGLPGFNNDVDRDYYPGSEEELRASDLIYR